MDLEEPRELSLSVKLPPEAVGREITKKDCWKFLSQFKVTHYVSSIQLSASEFEIVAESMKRQKFEMGGNIGVQIAEGSIDAKHSMRHHKKTRDIQKIGVIEWSEKNIATVKRGSHHEAVVGIQVKPISDLITS